MKILIGVIILELGMLGFLAFSSMDAESQQCLGPVGGPLVVDTSNWWTQTDRYNFLELCVGGMKPDTSATDFVSAEVFIQSSASCPVFGANLVEGTKDWLVAKNWDDDGLSMYVFMAGVNPLKNAKSFLRVWFDTKKLGALEAPVKFIVTFNEACVDSISFPLETSPIEGDMNADGKRTPSDAFILLQFLAGEISPADFPGIKNFSADLNKDGKINAYDAALILSRLPRYNKKSIL